MLVAELLWNGGGLKIHGIGVGEARGIRRGVVTDIEEVSRSIRQVREQVESTLGFSIERAFVSIGGPHIVALPSRGVVAVSRADGEISREDIRRVLAAAQAVPIGSNREVLHAIPREFVVDGEQGMKNVLGMSGVRLEVEALLLQVSSPALRNLERALREAGVTAEEIVLSSLASSQATLSKRQKELGVIAIDIGGGTTEAVVFEEGYLLHAVVLPVGAAHVTNDIAIGMRTSLEVAERVKLEYGVALSQGISKKEQIDLSLFDPNESGTFSRREVAMIIEARLEEIFELVTKALRKIDRERLLPAGVVLSGGGAKLPGIVELAKRQLKLPAQLGYPQAVPDLPEQVDDPTFVTALGLVLWGSEFQEGSRHRLPFRLGGISVPRFLQEGVGRAKNLFRVFLP